MSCHPNQTRSPSARTSKGFLIVGTGVTSSRTKFKKTIAKYLRFTESSAISHLPGGLCEISKALIAGIQFQLEVRLTIPMFDGLGCIAISIILLVQPHIQKLILMLAKERKLP